MEALTCPPVVAFPPSVSLLYCTVLVSFLEGHCSYTRVCPLCALLIIIMCALLHS